MLGKRKFKKRAEEKERYRKRAEERERQKKKKKLFFLPLSFCFANGIEAYLHLLEPPSTGC